MSPRPFTIAMPNTVLADLHHRLAQTRWPKALVAPGGERGETLSYLQEVIQYWQTTFDWHAREAMLNALPQFLVEINGRTVHYMHVHGHGPQPLPIVLTHGWPSSFLEYLKILPLLTNPARFGGDAADAFDVIVPSYPGYGFSDVPPEGAMQRADIALLWKHLMVDVLGYEHFVAFGSDFGGDITDCLGRYHAQHVLGIQLVGVSSMPYQGEGAVPFSADENAYFQKLEQLRVGMSGYSHEQETRPQTLAYALADSPTGLAAWIIEKFREWSDCDGDVERVYTKDELLTNVSLYWHTNTIATSFGGYFLEAADRTLGRGEHIDVPTGFAIFPKNKVAPPIELAERIYNVQRWTEMPSGGHFPALEAPNALVEEMRTFFRPLRTGI